MNSPEHSFIERSANPWYQSFAGGAAVSFVFSAIVAAMLGWTFWQIRFVDEPRAKRLAEMQEKYSLQGVDSALEGQIRSLDTELRRDQFRRQRFVYRGTVYLVGGLLVFSFCVLAARGLAGPKPRLSQNPDLRAIQIRHAVQARLAVTIALVAMGSFALFMSLWTSSHRQDVPRDGQPVLPDWADRAAGQWCSFRGPWGNGVVVAQNIPTEWDGPSGKSILWKSDVSLPGHSSPIVWDKRVFVSGADGAVQKIFCFDGDSGKPQWDGIIDIGRAKDRAKPEISEDTGYAASTPATDGKFVCAIFATGDIGCFDMAGKKVWEKAMGVPESAYGYASSLAVFDGLVFVQFDQGSEPGKSRLIAFELATGKTAWTSPRPVPNSWTSPTIARTEKGYQILASGSPWLAGYDVSEGKELWRAQCLGGEVAPSQIWTSGLVLAVEPYNRLVAVRLENGGGDVSEGAVLWRADGNMPDICSPVSDGRYVWTLTTNGLLDCFSLVDGGMVYEKQLGGKFQASPSIVGDVLYFLSRSGRMLMVRAGGQYEELGANELGQECFASPAFVEGRIYVRSKTSLFCIGQK